VDVPGLAEAHVLELLEDALAAIHLSDFHRRELVNKGKLNPIVPDIPRITAA
jgi:hypothetical protein